MERLFRSLKSEWITPLGYRSIMAAGEDIDQYLSGYDNWHRPHTFNGGLAPAGAEKNLKWCLVLVDHYGSLNYLSPVEFAQQAA
jgi:hypothetical protein